MGYLEHWMIQIVNRRHPIAVARVSSQNLPFGVDITLERDLF
jgi:hypothetical protein